MIIPDKELESLIVSRQAKRTRIVCLCGSTRFRKAFEEANRLETIAGRIVLSVGVFVHSLEGHSISDEQKKALDNLHKQKIDLADEVLILNVGGYIGDSTKDEVEYAKKHRKTVRWLETHWSYPGIEENPTDFRKV